MLSIVVAAAAFAQEPVLPEPSRVRVDFLRDVKPIFDSSCIQCHAGDKRKGGFSINTRDMLVLGGENGRTVEIGKSDQSKLIHMVAGIGEVDIMPPKGERLTAEQVGLLRAWIDQGAVYAEGFSYAEEKESRLAPRRPELPTGTLSSLNPIDLLLEPYFKERRVERSAPVDDRTYARRVYLDLTGLLPTPQQLDAYLLDTSHDKRTRLVDRLLASHYDYAIHWMTFWNDALRNGYAGTGFIDNGRGQLTGWLFKSLYDNKPYDQFVRELINPVPGSEAFTKGIVWRGVVNASQVPPMQAAQSLSQVFLGLNLKCASCHDSPISEWRLEDAYALATVFSDEPLDVHRCDKPIGRKSLAGFIYPQLGNIDPNSPRTERQARLAELLTSPENGRLSRTIVNRLWAALLGRGLVEPVDEMDNNSWNADLLDFLASDLQDHGYDLKRTLKLICTSHAYQMPSVGASEKDEGRSYVFRGPHVRRLTAEQYADALSMLTGHWQPVTPLMIARDGRGQGGQLGEVRALLGSKPDQPIEGERVRAALALLDPLMTAMGRPMRDQVVTRRDSAATTLQALELTNGTTLDQLLKQGAEHWMKEGVDVEKIYQSALGRPPTGFERSAAREILGQPATSDGVQDLLWIITMQPEFQLIH